MDQAARTSWATLKTVREKHAPHPASSNEVEERLSARPGNPFPTKWMHRRRADVVDLEANTGDIVS